MTRQGGLSRGAKVSSGSLEILSRADLARVARWPRAFAHLRKDHRYYELIEDTIAGFEYYYFGIKDASGTIRAVAPFFLLDQDLLQGSGEKVRAAADAVRRFWPRFLRMRTLMVGCTAGEGHFDTDDELSRYAQARILANDIVRHAKALKASLIVFKEFPLKYRKDMQPLLEAGFGRAPSFPMTELNIDFPDFEVYMKAMLTRKTRRDLRLKFRATDAASPITLSILTDVTPIIDEIYPLYLAVYKRSTQHFEKLTKEYFCRLGREMPDKTRFFVWRQEGRVIALSICMLEGDALYGEYLGLDYSVALDLHLYHYAVRDTVSWGMENGYKWFRSSGLNYDPKYHLRAMLDPIDLYVRHTSYIGNAIMRRVLPLIEPTRGDPTLKKFANYADLWADPSEKLQGCSPARGPSE
jgi:predicted N-acyltransferase